MVSVTGYCGSRIDQFENFIKRQPAKESTVFRSWPLHDPEVYDSEVNFWLPSSNHQRSITWLVMMIVVVHAVQCGGLLAFSTLWGKLGLYTDKVCSDEINIALSSRVGQFWCRGCLCTGSKWVSSLFMTKKLFLGIWIQKLARQDESCGSTD